MNLKFEDIQDDALRRLLLLVYIEYLLTSMQENWREQYLFDVYEIIHKEIEGSKSEIPTVISAPDVTVKWDDPELYEKLIKGSDAEWFRTLQPFADFVDLMDDDDK